MTVTADELFIFAGAGVSRSRPTALPVFDQLRNEVLRQLDLTKYIWRDGTTNPEKIAGQLAPEEFMLQLSQAPVDVESWLTKVLSPNDRHRPNAAHRALAQLAAAGSKVWTVNFDTFIEAAAEEATAHGDPLRTVSWPATDLPAGAQLLKPHGSIPGKLIVTAEQVIGNLDPSWLKRLRDDVEGRTVLFIGYRGRDLDFRPLWQQVLRSARRVVWFDLWSLDEATGKPVMQETAEKCGLLPELYAEGRLELARPAPLPPGAPPDSNHNPSWDFIAWCQERGLVTVDSQLIQQLFEPKAKKNAGEPVAPAEPGEAERFPALQGKTVWARSALQGLLGDYRGAREGYWKAASQPRDAPEAVKKLAVSYVMHGGNGIAAMLGLAALLPSVGRLATYKERARRLRLSALARTGRHRAVLQGTKSLPDDAVSVYLILRSQSLRLTGSLDEAAMIAGQARVKAAAEEHPFRLPNAAYQECQALLWAGRLDEVQVCLRDYLREYAKLGANRWSAWADFVEACLLIRREHGKEALRKCKEATMRFEAEGLIDGVVSVKTAALTAYRLTGEAADYTKTLDALKAVIRRNPDDKSGRSRYYTRKNDFTEASIMNDEAEFLRRRGGNGDRQRAWELYQRTAASPYRLQSALGHLGLALLEAAKASADSDHAATAREIAKEIGFRLVVDRQANS